MSRVNFNNNAGRQIATVIGARLDVARMYLAAQIKADISQSGTLRYNPTLKSGRASKQQKTIYNFTHSLPGNPPFKQTGTYRRSITSERSGLVARVGTNMILGRWLELGTRKMKPRPHIRANLIKHVGTIRSIVCATIKPGEMNVTSNQSRGGRFGIGAVEAGYAVQYKYWTGN